MKYIWITIGFTALALGAIGAILPLLPTTPFILLAAFAFGKSSERLRNMLTNHPIFGPMIVDWETHGAIAMRYKILAALVMFAVFLISIISQLPTHIILIQLGCYILGLSYIFTRPSSKKAKKLNL